MADHDANDRFNPDSFSGRISLVAIDKLLFGLAALVVGLIIQDWYQTGQREREQQRALAQVELSLLKDVPRSVNDLVLNYLSLVDEFALATDQRRTKIEVEMAAKTTAVDQWFDYSKALAAPNMRLEGGEKLLQALRSTNDKVRGSTLQGPTLKTEEIELLKTDVLSANPAALNDMRSILVRSATRAGADV